MKKIYFKIIKRYKTPVFIYKKRKIKNIINYLKKTKSKIYYAIKANYNIKIIKYLKKRMLNFETVSIGEINFLNKLGIKGKRIIFSGVCKSTLDLKTAIKKKIKYISVDSYEELKRLEKITKKKTYTKIILKLNLNIKPKTNKKIMTGSYYNKFGINIKKYKGKITKIINKGFLKVKGIGFHIGSQIFSEKPYRLAINRIKKYINYFEKKKIKIKLINIGGGFGFDYEKKNQKINIKNIINYAKKKTNKKIIIEPGRIIVAGSCLTISKVEYLKKTKKVNFAIIDVGMESIIRPMLYKSNHKIINIIKRKKKQKQIIKFDIVGPICESTDIIKKSIKMDIRKDDYLIIKDTGAYCMSMRMIYNMRRKPKEVFI
ncbi:diaminopimelate decarboxylase [Candidatus Vidania fulgoroideorum]